jgi:hypothetical protein
LDVAHRSVDVGHRGFDLDHGRVDLEMNAWISHIEASMSDIEASISTWTRRFGDERLDVAPLSVDLPLRALDLDFDESIVRSEFYHDKL